jgi:hypothetical protein
VIDRARLAKLLALSQSDNDAEALSCIRAANKMVQAAGKSWDEVLVQITPGMRITIQKGPYKAEEAWPTPRPKRPA